MQLNGTGWTHSGNSEVESHRSGLRSSREVHVWGDRSSAGQSSCVQSLVGSLLTALTAWFPSRQPSRHAGSARRSPPPASFPFPLGPLSGGTEQRRWRGWDESTGGTESLRGAGQRFREVPEIKGEDAAVQGTGERRALPAQAVDLAWPTVETHSPYLK